MKLDNGKVDSAKVRQKSIYNHNIKMLGNSRKTFGRPLECQTRSFFEKVLIFSVVFRKVLGGFSVARQNVFIESNHKTCR